MITCQCPIAMPLLRRYPRTIRCIPMPRGAQVSKRCSSCHWHWRCAGAVRKASEWRHVIKLIDSLGAPSGAWFIVTHDNNHHIGCDLRSWVIVATPGMDGRDRGNESTTNTINGRFAATRNAVAWTYHCRVIWNPWNTVNNFDRWHKEALYKEALPPCHT
jgi:hypothetical protein